MQLYIGGFAQGKLTFVLEENHLSSETVADGSSICSEEELKGKKVLNHYHLLVKRQLKQGISPEDFFIRIKRDFPELIVISDEVGNGIVPMDASCREYRESLGRLLCDIAAESGKVVRIFCGIGQRLK